MHVRAPCRGVAPPRAGRPHAHSRAGARRRAPPRPRRCTSSRAFATCASAATIQHIIFRASGSPRHCFDLARREWCTGARRNAASARQSHDARTPSGWRQSPLLRVSDASNAPCASIRACASGHRSEPRRDVRPAPPRPYHLMVLFWLQPRAVSPPRVGPRRRCWRYRARLVPGLAAQHSFPLFCAWTFDARIGK